MASPSSPKVVLKNTTRMSLNERFTEMLASKQPVQVTFPAAQEAQLQKTGNQKLVQQMESRPSVRAALTLKADSITQGLVTTSHRLKYSPWWEANLTLNCVIFP
uniref:Uncharacterized protein n=1 Tax=Vombatus ursinus TaxID=29139 RepID=A0A4X2JZJ7_VOMUR